MEINDKSLYAKEGDVLLFHPGDSYKAWCHEADHCYFLVTFFADLSTLFGTQTPFCSSENVLADYSLPEISNMLNFADQYSFSKAFKNYFGEAPGKFRKHCIECR